MLSLVPTRRDNETFLRLEIAEREPKGRWPEVLLAKNGAEPVPSNIIHFVPDRFAQDWT